MRSRTSRHRRRSPRPGPRADGSRSRWLPAFLPDRMRRPGRADRPLPGGTADARATRRRPPLSSSRSTTRISSTRFRPHCCTTSRHRRRATARRGSFRRTGRRRHHRIVARRSRGANRRAAARPRRCRGPAPAGRSRRRGRRAECASPVGRDRWQPALPARGRDRSAPGGNPEAVHGVWRWRGNVHVGARLRELVELRLATLDDDERELVALLAVGDVVPLRRSSNGLFGAGDRATPTSRLRRDRAPWAAGAPVARPSALRGSGAHLDADRRAHAMVPIPGRVVRLRLRPTRSRCSQRAVWTIDGGVATDGELLPAAEVANKQ